MNQTKNINLSGIFAALLCGAMWGSSFVTVKLALLQLPPLFVSALRLSLAGIVLIGFVEAPRRCALFQIFLISITLYVVNFALINSGIKYVDAGLASIIIQFEVPMAAILSMIFLHERLSIIQIVGLIISFIGIFLVSYMPHVFGHLIGVILLLGGAFSYALSMIQIKILKEVKALSLVVYSSLMAGIQLMIASFFMEHNQLSALEHINLTTAFSMLSYIILGTLTFFIWTRLLHRYYINQIMPFSLLTSVFAIAFGAFFLNEIITLRIILGAILTISGVALVTLRVEDLLTFFKKVCFSIQE